VEQARSAGVELDPERVPVHDGLSPAEPVA
jgi:hypothetical protein